MVCDNIRKIREAKGIMKIFLAKTLGMTLNNYCNIEAGKTRLDVERLIIIAKALDVNGAIFLDDELTDKFIVEFQKPYPLKKAVKHE